MGPAALRFFHSLARKNLTKNQGSGIITIPNRMTSESEASAMIQTIVDSGLPLEKFDQFIRSEDDILKYLNIIKNANKQRVIPADSPEGRGITERLFGKQGEVVDMAGKKLDTSQGIMGGKSVKELMDSGQVSKGARGMKKSKKVQDREMFKAANERLTSDVNGIIKNIKSMEPITAMKEANSVIARKGKYKNLTPEQSKKILQDTEDHIFERYPVEDPEDFATGGRVSRGGGGTMGASDKGYQGGGRDKKGNVSGTAPGAAPGPGGNNNDGPKGPPSIINPPPKNNKPPIQTTSDDSVDRGFLSDVRKKNQAKYNRLINTYKPDDFDVMNQIDGTSNLSEEDAKFMERYGAGKKYRDLSKTNIENFFEIDPKGVAPKVKDLEMDVDRPREYDFAELSETQLDFLNSPKIQRDLKEFGREPKAIFDQLPNYEEGGIFGIGGQEPTTPQEYNEYLDSIGVPRMKAADGGRAAFMAGGMGRRGFLKMLAGLGGGIAAAKTGLLKLAGKEPAKQVAKEVVQKSTNTPPPYFFKLAEKIKTMGDDVTAKAATKDREVVTKFKEYELTEDVATGEMTIQRMKVLDDDSGSFYGNPLTEETYMSYKPGLADETTKGKIPPGEYEEGTALIRSDREYAGDVVDESFKISDDVIEEAMSEAPSIKIKKASGGIARMLGE